MIKMQENDKAKSNRNPEKNTEEPKHNIQGHGMGLVLSTNNDHGLVLPMSSPAIIIDRSL